MFDYPTLESLVAHLAGELKINEVDQSADTTTGGNGASDDLKDTSEEDIAMLLEQELSGQGGESTGHGA